MTNKIKKTEYASFYQPYITALSDNDMGLIENLEYSHKKALEVLSAISKEKQIYRYAEDKWTIKEIFQHIIDTERIFMYRCLRIARHDKTPLAGFEQNDYIIPSLANNKSIEQLLEEYELVRKNSIVLLKSLNNTDLKFIGNANGTQLSARAAAFSVLGHELWHIKIIKERYL